MDAGGCHPDPQTRSYAPDAGWFPAIKPPQDLPWAKGRYLAQGLPPPRQAAHMQGLTDTGRTKARPLASIWGISDAAQLQSSRGMG